MGFNVGNDIIEVGTPAQRSEGALTRCEEMGGYCKIGTGEFVRPYTQEEKRMYDRMRRNDNIGISILNNGFAVAMFIKPAVYLGTVMRGTDEVYGIGFDNKTILGLAMVSSAYLYLGYKLLKR